jgi:hypothetical protein
MLAPTTRASKTSKNIAGQYNSHFVYRTFSACWQHFDGQQLGHVQQQHKKAHKNMERINPIRKGTTYIPKDTPCYFTPSRTPDIFPSKAFLIIYVLNIIQFTYLL